MTITLSWKESFAQRILYAFLNERIRFVIERNVDEIFHSIGNDVDLLFSDHKELKKAKKIITKIIRDEAPELFMKFRRSPYFLKVKLCKKNDCFEIDMHSVLRYYVFKIIDFKHIEEKWIHIYNDLPVLRMEAQIVLIILKEILYNGHLSEKHIKRISEKIPYMSEKKLREFFCNVPGFDKIAEDLSEKVMKRDFEWFNEHQKKLRVKFMLHSFLHYPLFTVKTFFYYMFRDKGGHT